MYQRITLYSLEDRENNILQDELTHYSLKDDRSAIKNVYELKLQPSYTKKMQFYRFSPFSVSHINCGNTYRCGLPCGILKLIANRNNVEI